MPRQARVLRGSSWTQFWINALWDDSLQDRGYVKVLSIVHVETTPPFSCRRSSAAACRAGMGFSVKCMHVCFLSSGCWGDPANTRPENQDYYCHAGGPILLQCEFLSNPHSISCVCVWFAWFWLVSLRVLNIHAAIKHAANYPSSLSHCLPL